MSNSIIKKYLSAIRKNLSCPAKEKKSFISELEDALNEFLRENPEAAYNDVVENFGSPEKQANEFMESLDPNVVKKAFNIKRIIIIVAVIALLILGVFALIITIDSYRYRSGYGIESIENANTDELSLIKGSTGFTDYEGAYIVITSVETNTKDKTVFNVKWNNDTASEIEFGEPYSIEKKVVGEWVDTAIEDMAFNLPAYPVEPGETREKTYSSESFDISGEGEYRLIAPFTVDGKEYNTWVVFRVLDSDPFIEWYTVHFDATPEDEIEKMIEGEKPVVTVPYYQTNEGFYVAEGMSYKYCLAISGRMKKADKLTSFFVLSNREEVSFDEAYKASGLSSDTADYFDPGDAIIVGYRIFSQGS